jgi:hypothetical protein
MQDSDAFEFARTSTRVVTTAEERPVDILFCDARLIT